MSNPGLLPAEVGTLPVGTTEVPNGIPKSQQVGPHRAPLCTKVWERDSKGGRRAHGEGPGSSCAQPGHLRAAAPKVAAGARLCPSIPAGLTRP